MKWKSLESPATEASLGAIRWLRGHHINIFSENKDYSFKIKNDVMICIHVHVHTWQHFTSLTQYHSGLE